MIFLERFDAVPAFLQRGDAERGGVGLRFGRAEEAHHHDPDGEAILLGITDRPVFEAFNFYAETSTE
jgi:hypothetical protein